MKFGSICLFQATAGTSAVHAGSKRIMKQRGTSAVLFAFKSGLFSRQELLLDLHAVEVVMDGSS